MGEGITRCNRLVPVGQVEVLRLDDRVVAEGGGPLQNVLELPDIAREGMALEGLQGGRGECHGSGVAVTPADPLEDAPGQAGDVLGPLPQGRHAQLDHIDTVEEVLTKTPGVHLLLKVAVAGADDTHVHRDLLLGPDGPHVPFLDRAQQLDLGGQGQVGHLVEEEGPALGRLE